MQIEAWKLNPEALRRWSELARLRLEEKIQTFLGLILHADGSVSIEGMEGRHPTVDMVEPFGPIAHQVQLLRDHPARLLEFYRAYTEASHAQGARAETFDGQIEAFFRAIEEVPGEVRPQLRRVA